MRSYMHIGPKYCHHYCPSPNPLHGYKAQEVCCTAIKTNPKIKTHRIWPTPSGPLGKANIGYGFTKLIKALDKSAIEILGPCGVLYTFQLPMIGKTKKSTKVDFLRGPLLEFCTQFED